MNVCDTIIQKCIILIILIILIYLNGNEWKISLTMKCYISAELPVR